MSPNAVANQLAFLAYRLRNGCGNAGCQVKEPTGMHANGSCTCQPSNYAKQLLGLALDCEEQGSSWRKTKEDKP